MEQINIPKSTSVNISNIESRGSRMIRMVKTIKAITPINAVATFNENVTNPNVQNAASVNICNSGEKIKISTEPKDTLIPSLVIKSTLFELLVEQDLSSTVNASIIESPIVGLDNSLDTASKSILCSAGGNILPTYLDKNRPLNKTQESHLSPGSSQINTGVLEHPDKSPSDYSVFDDSDADPIYEPQGTNEISSDDEVAMSIERMAADIERRLDNNDKNQTNVENQKTRQIKRNLGQAYVTLNGVNTEPFKTLNVRRRGVSLVSINNVQLCYNGQIPINSRKKKDLMDLMPLVSPQFHAFYKNLVTDDIADIQPDLVEDDDEDV